MTDIEFIEQAEHVLLQVEQMCDRINDVSDADIDTQRTGGMLTITFANKSQIVINWQKPLHEIWMATKAGGFHYRFDGEKWMDTKGAGEFFTHLTQHASRQSLLDLNFAP